MSKNQNVETPEMVESIGEAVSKTELFLERNGRRIAYAIFALLGLGALIFGYKLLVVEPQMQRAAELIAPAQQLFESATPDYDAALYGNDAGVGFLEVADTYGSTPAGNLAKHYAGICFLYLNDLQSAIKYLSDYKAVGGVPAELINAQNFGLRGDIAANQATFSEALKLYTKAVSASENNLTAPLYLRKAAMIAIEMGDNKMAKELLKRIISQYPASSEVRTAEKYLGTIE